ncbi:MAG: DUF3240 family protein [Kordiimonadaceae bacterium]|nr:DUF3240 family protein [Kordiimonadaceae bacterium]
MVCLVSIIISKNIEDVVADWLLEQEGLTGFNSIPVNGYGLGEKHMSISEKVTGRTARVMFQFHIEEMQAETILLNLKSDFPGSDIHYMVTPLKSAGNLSSFIEL